MNPHICCRTGDLQRLRELIAEDVDLNQKDYDGRTPLHIACSYLNIELVEELLNYFLIHNIDQISIKDKNGWTPLHCACVPACWRYNEEDSLKIVQMLLECGANANVQKNDGFTPLHLASLQRKIELVKILVPFSDRSLKTDQGILASEITLSQTVKEFIENYQDIPEVKEPDSM